jgi:hypothetical protein
MPRMSTDSKTGVWGVGSGVWGQVSGVWSVGSGVWSVGSGVRGLGQNIRIMNNGDSLPLSAEADTKADPSRLTSFYFNLTSSFRIFCDVEKPK